MTNASNRATDLRLATTDDGTTGRLQIAVESVLGNRLRWSAAIGREVLPCSRRTGLNHEPAWVIHSEAAGTL